MVFRRHWFLILISILVFFPAQSVFAQDEKSAAEDSVNVVKDSLKNEALVANTKLLQKLDSVKKADSLRRANLEEELSSLKTTDNLKKQELIEELERLKSAEQEVLIRQKQQVDSLRSIIKGFPVSPFIDTIFYVYAKLGPFTPQARAKNIEDKILTLEEDVFFKEDSIYIFPSEMSVDLIYQDVIILSITDKDAIWMSMGKRELAEHYRTKIIASIKQHREATSLQNILKEIALAIVVILFVGVLIYLINKLFRFLRLKIYQGKGKWINGIKIRNYELFTADSEVRALTIASNFIKWIIILVTIYLALPVLFSIFPWTKNFATTMLGYILNPLKKILFGIWDYLPDLITIVVIVIIFRYVNKGFRFLKDEIKNGNLTLPGFYPDWAMPTYMIIRILMFAFMIVVIFPYLPGSDSPAFQGVSVFLGVLFTFGSSGSLSNIIAGLVLTYMRAYKIGDRVMIGSVSGDIIEKTLLVTRIRTIKNEDITIPNSTVMNSHTINYSSASQNLGLIVHTTITIGYDVPWRKVHELMISAANECEYIQENPKPFVLQTSLDDFYVSYQLNAYTREPQKQAVIYSELHQNIQDKFNEAGVEIMSPHYGALRDGNQVTIPSDYLPEEYITPSFNVNQIKKDKPMS